MDFVTGTALFRGLTDLASAALGGQALLASDEFFAGKENMLQPHEPEWREGAYTDRGKWMDGWEPRRRRAPGHDWCIVRLGAPGDLLGVDIDTRFFLGNHAPYASLWATCAPADAAPEWLRDHASWTPVLQQVSLERGGHNVFGLSPFPGATHIRLNIYPAGGVARLRVYGRPKPVPLQQGERADLLSATRGGQALACSDMFFSRMDNLLLPFESATMADGWETKRSPLPRQDWAILALCQPGVLDSIEVSTRHFKGNYPEAIRIDGTMWPGAPPHALTASQDWAPIAGPTRLGPDRAHTLAVHSPDTWSHLKVTILSDGGISRVRAYGRAASPEPDALLRWLNGMPDQQAREAFLRCCGAARWARQMSLDRPYASRAHLHGHAEHTWWHLGDGDWREAFTHHPRIGADVNALREKFSSTAAWSAGEQAGVSGADEATLRALAEGNRAYEVRFGHIFIVCASGLRADEMLACLRERMDNPPEVELRVAAGEQARITRIRLDKLEVPR